MRKRSYILISVALVFVALAAPNEALGQRARLSQHGTVSQTVGSTEITVVYNRPVARGRELFGNLVPYGKTWNPGADQATYIAFSEDVLIADQPLGAGEYSIWVTPQKTGAWTFIFSTASDVFHVPYPEGQDALRVELSPERGSHMETLAFYFPLVEPDRTVLNFHWGETIVEIPITLAR